MNLVKFQKIVTRIIGQCKLLGEIIAQEQCPVVFDIFLLKLVYFIFYNTPIKLSLCVVFLIKATPKANLESVSN